MDRRPRLWSSCASTAQALRAALAMLAIVSCATSSSTEENGDRVTSTEPELAGAGKRSPDRASSDPPGSADSSGTNAPRVGRVSLETENGTIDIAYQIIDGIPIAEGDVVVPIEIRSATRIGRRWEGAVVPYVIEPDLPDPSRVAAAIAHWQEKTNVRFVARTTQSDYVSFRSATGCSSLIGRASGKQSVNLATGETASNVVAIGIDASSGRVYYFYRRGFATAGTTTRADASQPHFKYALPSGKTPTSLVDVAFGSGGHLFAWYSDGTFSEGTVTDFVKYAAPAPYTLAPTKLPKDVVAFAIDASGQAHAFYKDGTFSVGTPGDLDLTTAPQTFAVAPGESVAALAHVDVTAGGVFQAFYSDGRVSSGTAAKLSATSGLARVSFPGHCGVGATIHEIGHVVGLFHEQTRQDRDDFVTINWANIQSGQSYNFEKYSIPTGNDTGPYDFASIMHYTSSAFSSNGQPTIVKVDGSTFTAQRTTLSPGDIAAAEMMYPAPPANP